MVEFIYGRAGEKRVLKLGGAILAGEGQAQRMFLHTLRITAGTAMNFNFTVFLESRAAVGKDIFYRTLALPGYPCFS